MEILQVEGIIQNLFDIRLKHLSFSDFELKAEDKPTKQQDDIDSLSESWNVVLENDLSIFILPRLQRLLHDVDLVGPGFIGCGHSNSVIVIHEGSQQSLWRLL